MPKTYFAYKFTCLDAVWLQTAWAQHHPETRPTPYYIAKEIHLTEAEWNHFTQSFQIGHDWIAAFSKEKHEPKADAVAAIRVTCDSSEIALIIDPQGYDYARCVGIEGQA